MAKDKQEPGLSPEGRTAFDRAMAANRRYQPPPQPDIEGVTDYLMGERIDPPTIEALRARSEGLTDGALALVEVHKLIEAHVTLLNQHEALKAAFGELLHIIDERFDLLTTNREKFKQYL